MNEGNDTNHPKRGYSAMLTFAKIEDLRADTAASLQDFMVDRTLAAWKLGTKEPLPHGYTPSPQSVVVGRGGHSSGRNRLRGIARMFLGPYSQATTKHEKSAIVSKIIEIIEDGCPYGAFVKYSGGRWWQAEESKAREKVGYVMRDLLHDKYRSSTQSKAAARKNRRLVAKRDSGFAVGSFSSSSCSSSADETDRNVDNKEAAQFFDKEKWPEPISLVSRSDPISSSNNMFEQQDQVVKPTSILPEVDIFSTTNVLSLTSGANTLTTTRSLDTHGSYHSDLDICKMRRYPTEVPVGEDLSSVFDSD